MFSAELFSQIDQKINELVAEQQKNDAELALHKSELEQLRQDVANADKQKQSIFKSLEKKVYQTPKVAHLLSLQICLSNC